MSRPLSAGRIPVGRRCPGARVLEPDSCAFVFIRGFRLAPCNPASLPIDRSRIDPDRPQTTDAQDQSTSDRFLKLPPQHTKTQQLPLSLLPPALVSTRPAFRNSPLPTSILQKSPAIPHFPPNPTSRTSVKKSFPGLCIDSHFSTQVIEMPNFAHQPTSEQTHSVYKKTHSIL
jgi:hypothetical protein